MPNVALEIEEDRVRLVIDETPRAGGEVGQRREFRGEMCSSPLCHCREVAFVEQADADHGARQPRRFALDPFDRRPGQPAETPEAEVLASHVADALDAASWRKLTAAFLAVKARAIEEIDCERERASFAFDGVERDGELVPYRETIPFAPEIRVADGARELLVDEQHCVRPGCDCSEAILLVHAIDDTVAPDGTRTVTQVAALRVDHRRGRWADPDTGEPLRREALEVRRLLLAQHPDLLDTLRRQQTLLRRLYQVAAASAGRRSPVRPTPVVAAPRVGRNEPCPCGSGKKFKKCCLTP